MAETRKTGLPYDAPEGWHVQVTVEQLTQAVEDYEMLLPVEIEAAYRTLLGVPLAGLKIAMALQQAMLDASKGGLPRDRVLDAAVVPAFLLGVLVGMSKKVLCGKRIREGQPWICNREKGHAEHCVSSTGVPGYRDDLF
jgi:hypothetical protein